MANGLIINNPQKNTIMKPPTQADQRYFDRYCRNEIKRKAVNWEVIRRVCVYKNFLHGKKKSNIT